MSRRDEAADAAVRAVRALTPKMAEIARRIGVSHNTVRSWSIGRNTPNRENLDALAVYIDEQADRLRGLARELREMAESGASGETDTMGP